MATGSRDPAPGAVASEGLEALFVSRLPWVEEVIGAICRRRGLDETEAQDFSSVVKLKLIENDYAVLARFARRSSLETYLTTVIQRTFIDYGRKMGARWRPSRKAEALGPVAVRLEELRDRDGLPFDEICEVLISNENVGFTRRELAELETGLPRRPARILEGPEALDSAPSAEPTPEERLLESE